ncbi:hypothetical protein ACVWYH_001926 [Bradyrhizobium sp. GM24.11]
MNAKVSRHGFGTANDGRTRVRRRDERVSCSRRTSAARGSSDVFSREVIEECADSAAQELCQPSQEQAEVVAGGGDDSVDVVAESLLEMIAVALTWPMTGLTAARRFISRRIEAVTRRT